MRRFGFRGFTEGAAVALSVYQNGQMQGASVPAWGVSASASVGIQVSLPQTLVTPAQVWVRATAPTGLNGFNLTGLVYDGAFHEYFYFWSVRGAPLAPFSAPQNMVPQWNDPNLANGREVGFCLTGPGDYIIDLLVMDRDGTTAVASTSTITVQDADAVYPGAATLCVSFEDNFDGKPENAGEVTSLAALEAALTARDDPNTRVLFRRGETYPDFSLRLQGKTEASYFGAYGPASQKPVIRPIFKGGNHTAINSCLNIDGITDVRSYVMTGLKFLSDWDVTSETGSIGFNRMVSVSQLKYEDAHFLFHDLEFEDFDTGIGLGNTVRPYDTDNRFMVADCVFEGWKNYGIFASRLPGNRIAVIGNRIMQKVDALNGGEKSVGLMNNHGPTRFADITGVYFAMNDVFSRTGWSGTDQQCLRLTTSALPDQWSWTDRNVMEGGYLTVSLEGQNDGEDDLPGNHMIERNLMIATAINNLDFVSSHKGGTTVRGNYGYMPANPWVQASGGLRSAFSFTPNKPADGNADEPVALYGNTVLALRDAAQSDGLTYQMATFDTFTTFVDENNLIHAPYLATPVIPAEPVDAGQTLPGVSLRYKGLRMGFEPVRITLPDTIADGGALQVAYADIHQRLAIRPGTINTIDVDGATDTDQAYWQDVESAGDNRHTITIPGIGALCAHLGHFTVSFADPTHAILTNTSGLDWGAAGMESDLKLHRNSKIPPMDTSYGHDGQAVPLAVPASAQSAAWQSATGAFVPPHTFIEATPRPSPISQGAL